jgi:hypothetical protein
MGIWRRLENLDNQGWIGYPEQVAKRDTRRKLMATATLTKRTQIEMRIPQLILRLSPSGEVVAELPGANGSRRVVSIESLDQVRRILRAQMFPSERRIGHDAAPTQAQIKSWLKANPRKRARTDILRKAGLL